MITISTCSFKWNRILIVGGTVPCWKYAAPLAFLIELESKESRPPTRQEEREVKKDKLRKGFSEKFSHKSLKLWYTVFYCLKYF